MACSLLAITGEEFLVRCSHLTDNDIVCKLNPCIPFPVGLSTKKKIPIKHLNIRNTRRLTFEHCMYTVFYKQFAFASSVQFPISTEHTVEPRYLKLGYIEQLAISNRFPFPFVLLQGLV